MKLLSINCAGGQNVICALSLSEGELKSLVSDSEVLIFQSGIQISAELLASASTLRLLLRAGSGFDNVDLDYVQRHQIKFVTRLMYQRWQQRFSLWPRAQHVHRSIQHISSMSLLLSCPI
jgi:hypothetical protein